MNNYLNDVFKIKEKEGAASREVAAFVEGSECLTEFTDESKAKAWLRRVKKWIQQTCDAIRQDSIPAPGRSHERWLLYDASCVVTNASTGRINCHLCNKCRASLSGVTGKERKPSVNMPLHARANGMWRGPDPVELSRLTYAECKVINLSRIYVSVKRIFLNRSSYARSDASEAPLFHQKNVVAYPQNPDAALRALGMSPANLAHTLQVQFVGGDRSCLRSHADLQVSVGKLRSAFVWLSTKSWPFMEATKHHDAWE